MMLLLVLTLPNPTCSTRALLHLVYHNSVCPNQCCRESRNGRILFHRQCLFLAFWADREWHLHTVFGFALFDSATRDLGRALFVSI